MSDVDSEIASSNGSFKSNEGDWVCSDAQCGNINFARRKTCNRCSKDRIDIPKKKKLGQEIGKVAAEKSKGLFSADDWQCNKCGNVNWARRQQCNMCNAPKFGEVEERTGLGGGYNDRGVVEYKQREDSDDEYDEFGRRKKRRRKGTATVDDLSSDSSSANEHRDKQRSETVPLTHSDKQEEDEKEEENEEENNEKEDDIEDEEEEDDDDDDDGDLSKYDLSDWGDAALPAKDRDISRTSRSRSRSPLSRR